jgi:DNA-binding NarL/FixJ family response regulator
MPIRVLVIDDFAPFRSFARAVLEFDDDIVVVGEAANGVDGVAAAEDLQPDVVLLDWELPDLRPENSALLIGRVAPHTNLVFCSAYDVIERAENVAGAAGFITKTASVEKFTAAVRAAAGQPEPAPAPDQAQTT